MLLTSTTSPVALPRQQSPTPSWSEREVTLLQLLAAGADTAEVAKRLCYSTRTVKTVVADVTTRLGARNRTHAVVIALRDGIIELP